MGYAMKGFGGFGNSPVKQTTQTGNVTPNYKKLLKSERNGVMAYEGKSNTEIQNDLEDRIEFINEDISNNGKATNQQKIDIAVLKGKLRKAKEAALKTPTTTEHDEAAGDKAINDPAGMYGPGKGKQLSELSKKELKALGFSPKKIKEIMAVDPDAPGTPGKPGYEPRVKRKDLDANGKDTFDKNHGMITKDGKPYME